MSSVICISYVYDNINEYQIETTFNTLGLGEVIKIEFPYDTTRECGPYNIAHVHIKWHTNDKTKQFIDALTKGDEIQIIYDKQCYWKIININPQPTPPQKPKKFKGCPLNRFRFTRHKRLKNNV